MVSTKPPEYEPIADHKEENIKVMQAISAEKRKSRGIAGPLTRWGGGEARVVEYESLRFCASTFVAFLCSTCYRLVALLSCDTRYSLFAIWWVARRRGASAEQPYTTVQLLR
uniref:Uncharacterized protein n=1 Tax=Glossina austeni TaxID=7395 RepID=A0A1A9VW05_GLOAU